TSSLQALASAACVDKHVRWDFSPAVAGATTGPASEPDAGEISTNTYTAPGIIQISTRITVTVTSLQDFSKTASTTITLTPLVDVGVGAPTPSMQQAFINAFFRNGFNNQVTLPPAGNVTRLGSTGYIQVFNGVVSGTKLALATVSPSAPAPGDGT